MSLLEKLGCLFVSLLVTVAACYFVYLKSYKAGEIYACTKVYANLYNQFNVEYYRGDLETECEEAIERESHKKGE